MRGLTPRARGSFGYLIRVDINGRGIHWDGPLLVGKTPIGRATIRVLKINLDHRVGYRRELVEEGVFPPR